MDGIKHSAEAIRGSTRVDSSVRVRCEYSEGDGEEILVTTSAHHWSSCGMHEGLGYFLRRLPQTWRPFKVTFDDGDVVHTGFARALKFSTRDDKNSVAIGRRLSGDTMIFKSIITSASGAVTKSWTDAMWFSDYLVDCEYSTERPDVDP